MAAKAKKVRPEKKVVEIKKDEQFITELDQYLFGQGTHYDIFKKLGAHPIVKGGVEGTHFAVWAPNAYAVNLVGSFNDWNEEDLPMERLEPLGIYVLFVPGVGVGATYKYMIHASYGRKLFKADPFGNHAEFRPGTASKVADISQITWSDDKWMENRKKFEQDKSPVSIYEVHPGSWRKHQHEEGDRVITITASLPTSWQLI